MRAGKINDYVINNKPNGKAYEYEIVSLIDQNNYVAPNGILDRAKEYKDYYGVNDYVYNF